MGRCVKLMVVAWLMVLCLAALPVMAQKGDSPAKVVPGGPQGRYLSLPSAMFAPGAPVVITWRNTPGNARDWVTVVPAGISDRKWGKWTYLQGRTSGRFTVRNLPRGAYEARLYFNWPKGGFRVIERLSFRVGGAVGGLRGQYLALPSAVFAPGTPVVITWRNTPGNARDWVTVVPAGISDRKWGKWTYLKGQTAGAFRVRGLPPGAYEARLYFNWPKGGFRVIERLRFTVQ
ncbi:MAG: hypothetical protein KKC37_16400 [Proteobacteria bacterium]|nr:hypothetical protein [Pseudomonadota bacterium]